MSSFAATLLIREPLTAVYMVAARALAPLDWQSRICAEAAASLPDHDYAASRARSPAAVKIALAAQKPGRECGGKLNCQHRKINPRMWVGAGHQQRVSGARCSSVIARSSASMAC